MKEVVVDADFVEFENLRPDTCEYLLDRGPRRGNGFA
jgi:hypothetical protein